MTLSGRKWLNPTRVLVSYRTFPFGWAFRPILDPVTGQEPAWPPVDVIVGNPPFLGSKFHLRRLGGDYVQKLRAAYAGRVPPGADLVCYWFEKARAMAAGGEVRRIGLLATKSIANAEPSRQVLDRIVAA